jgi:hypothetical protein
VPLVIGVILALSVGVFATGIGLDRDRAFYPVVTIVIPLTTFYSPTKNTVQTSESSTRACVELPMTLANWHAAPCGAAGRLSILFLFRFLHPRLVIPWSAVERCENVRFWFMKQVAVHISGFNRRLLFGGILGSKIMDAWIRSRGVS